MNINNVYRVIVSALWIICSFPLYILLGIIFGIAGHYKMVRKEWTDILVNIWNYEGEES